MGANPPRPLLTPQEPARTEPRRSPPLRLLRPQNLSGLDQSNLRQSKPKKQNLRGCVPVEGGERGVGEMTAARICSPKDETSVLSLQGSEGRKGDVEALGSYGWELLRIQLSFRALGACIFSHSMRLLLVCARSTRVRVFWLTHLLLQVKKK